MEGLEMEGLDAHIHTTTSKSHIARPNQETTTLTVSLTCSRGRSQSLPNAARNVPRIHDVNLFPQMPYIIP